MFLNDLGQPLILDAQKKYGHFEQHNGALVLTSAAFKEHVVPTEWCACIIGSEEHMLRLRSQDNCKEVYKYCTRQVISPNKPTEVTFDQTKITLTLIPVGKSKDGMNMTMYCIENGHTRTLIVDELSGYLDFLPKACASVHRALGEGIDIVYIDDALLGDKEFIQDLYAFVDLIRPKHIYGLRNHRLPKWLLDLCVQRDLYPRSIVL
ncbi:uncharacterized protein LOC6594962 [Drosophila persimilis]|uniref:uncharacterized protein LOC6594962 n=1 Tax=Drosophila persimilis TaxID=7234 RepID=UPI000F08A20F|nr:uncharacterized protein LOC6594962 [Drosophila persimilis]